MRALKICLWIAGVGCLLSIFGIFLPISAWESIAKFIGAQPLGLTDSPLVEYAIRLMSATYVGVGVFFVILALDPMKYGVMVPFAGMAAVLLGVVCAIIGLMVAMPVPWFLGDSIPCIVLGILILAFWKKAKTNHTIEE